MEPLRKLLDNVVKLEEIEMQIPLLKARCDELKEIVSERKNDRDWAILSAKNLENPGFFQRLLGRVAEKQEEAQTAARQAAAIYEESKRELDEAAYQLDALQKTQEALSGSREDYELARAAFLKNADVDAVQQLRMLETDAFRPIAIESVRQIRKALNAARGWRQKDSQPGHGALKNRRTEFLQLADQYAEKLQTLLVYFPEGSVSLGASMTAPSDYVRGVFENLSQTDLLNIAIEQSLRVQAQLEKL